MRGRRRGALRALREALRAERCLEEGKGKES